MGRGAKPLTSPNPLAWLPIVTFTVVLAVVAVRLAGGLDAGASIVADRDHGEARLGLLYGPSGLAIRLQRATVIGWWIAIGISAFLYGLIAKSTGATISRSVK
jgi:ABC-2 type transport system permease protein